MVFSNDPFQRRGKTAINFETSVSVQRGVIDQAEEVTCNVIKKILSEQAYAVYPLPDPKVPNLVTVVAFTDQKAVEYITEALFHGSEINEEDIKKFEPYITVELSFDETHDLQLSIIAPEDSSLVPELILELQAKKLLSDQVNSITTEQ